MKNYPTISKMGLRIRTMETIMRGYQYEVVKADELEPVLETLCAKNEKLQTELANREYERNMETSELLARIAELQAETEQLREKELLADFDAYLFEKKFVEAEAELNEVRTSCERLEATRTALEQRLQAAGAALDKIYSEFKDLDWRDPAQQIGFCERLISDYRKAKP